jgi:outer membrane protein OmpA-like peptidoglycan-associated protein
MAIDHRVKMVKVSGKVIDEETNAPVSTKLTILQNDFSTLEITTNMRGEFSAAIPESSNCRIAVRANGFEAQDDIISLASAASHYIEIRLVPFIKVMMTGEVVDGRDKKPLAAELKVYRNSDFASEQEDVKSIAAGSFAQPLTDYGFYIIDFSAKGYQNTTDTVWVLNYHRKILHKNFELVPLEAGVTVELKNIHFNFGKTSLSADSFAELDRLAEFFLNNPSLQVEIAGHTDSDGPTDYNLLLSQSRAQEVVNYLKSRGVNNAQLFAKGYGASKPIDSNSTLEGKANNRRVEMTVVKN